MHCYFGLLELDLWPVISLSLYVSLLLDMQVIVAVCLLSG